MWQEKDAFTTGQKVLLAMYGIVVVVGLLYAWKAFILFTLWLPWP